MTITCTRFSKIPCFCPACTQGAIMTPPPEPESYSSTSTGTPAPLSPDVGELVRRVRHWTEGGEWLFGLALQLADTCERLAGENAKLRELMKRVRKQLFQKDSGLELVKEMDAALKENQ